MAPAAITLDVPGARRLAIARAGLWRPEPTGLRSAARRREAAARADAQAIVERFGYLQLDTVAVTGARSHAIVLLSRLEGFDAELAEGLLRPGAPLFEYWGHEASWIPNDLYPAFAFRRRAFKTHPWWGDLLTEHSDLARRIVARIASEGPLRSADLEGSSSAGWWNLKLSKKIATALWSAGELAIRERRGFLRTFDLRERVIPAELRGRDLADDAAMRVLLARALAGHGWATTSTLAATWRLRNCRPAIRRALAELVEAGEVVPATLVTDGGTRRAGWIRVEDLALVDRLRRSRPRRDRGVLLSPFDPLLWDRGRVRELFDFDQILEIFKPPAQRVYGYYCMPVLAADRLIARVDLKADRRRGSLRVLALHREPGGDRAARRAAVDHALRRYADALGLRLRRR
jgi:hypothetical protein